MELIIAEKAIAGRRIAAILAGKDVPQTAEAAAAVFKFKKEEKDEKENSQESFGSIGP
jgi:hypothetical protein